MYIKTQKKIMDFFSVLMYIQFLQKFYFNFIKIKKLKF
jgi:hypothetical protein